MCESSCASFIRWIFFLYMKVIVLRANAWEKTACDPEYTRRNVYIFLVSGALRIDKRCLGKTTFFYTVISQGAISFLFLNVIVSIFRVIIQWL